MYGVRPKSDAYHRRIRNVVFTQEVSTENRYVCEDRGAYADRHFFVNIHLARAKCTRRDVRADGAKRPIT